MLWYKHWGEVWPDNTVLSKNLFFNEGATQFIKLGQTTNNTIIGNTLSGNSFEDFPNLKPITDKKSRKDLKSKIKAIRKVGNRKELDSSQALKVVRSVFNDIPESNFKTMNP
jgi:hypothetical protein